MKTNRLGPLVLAVLMLSALASVAPVHAATPVISSSQGSAARGVTVLTFNLSPLSTDALVVFEWFGTTNNPCSFILTPSDAQAQTWGAVGNCVQDGLVGAIRAFAVASYSSNQPDTVNCNFGGPNTQIEACYVFDISTPGTITLLGSNIGSGTAISLASGATAGPNALLLATAGIQAFCQAVSLGAGGTAYIPSSACSTSNYGLSGEYFTAGSGGLTSTFPMSVPISSVWSELVVQVAQPTVIVTTTIYTATQIGWLVPDSTHFSNTLMLIILPLMGMIFAMFPFMLDRRPGKVGDRVIFPALIGLTLGSALADLSVSPTSLLQIPFADIVAAGILTFLWWWNS